MMEKQPQEPASLGPASQKAEKTGASGALHAYTLRQEGPAALGPGRGQSQSPWDFSPPHSRPRSTGQRGSQLEADEDSQNARAAGRRPAGSPALPSWGAPWHPCGTLCPVPRASCFDLGEPQ